jgi:CO/xanthine dehydrogenase FAD-binding subunit
LINVAARVLLDASGDHIRDARIAIGPVAPVPFRAQEAETALSGRAISAEVISEAAEAAVHESKPRSSALRASKEYRRELIRTLTQRALTRAIEKARG